MGHGPGRLAAGWPSVCGPGRLGGSGWRRQGVGPGVGQGGQRAAGPPPAHPRPRTRRPRRPRCRTPRARARAHAQAHAQHTHTHTRPHTRLHTCAQAHAATNQYSRLAHTRSHARTETGADTLRQTHSFTVVRVSPPGRLQGDAPRGEARHSGTRRGMWGAVSERRALALRRHREADTGGDAARGIFAEGAGA